MATSKKTIVFATSNYTTTITDATVTNLSQITAYIPETVIGFESVFVDVAFKDIVTATGSNIIEHRVGLRLGAAAYTTITELDDITNSGENIAAVIGPFNFTSHFTTNWTGNSMTCDIQVYFDQDTGTTFGINNVNALLYITYLYDDSTSTNATQIKTVMIPMDSLVGSLTTTTNSNIGTNQIPILTGGSTPFLPESSVTIRDYFILLEGNTGQNGSTVDFTVSFNIDSGTSQTTGNMESALGTDNYVRITYKPSSVPDTTATHNFQCWASQTTRFNFAAFTLYVTYEFNASSSTKILNSIQIPLGITTPVGSTASTAASRFKKEILVHEPGTLTMKQSAFRINFNTYTVISGINFKAGSQSYRTYTHSSGQVSGMYSLQQRIDSGGAQGSGLTLARGVNNIVIDAYTTDATDEMAFVNGYVLLNYESDIPSTGIGSANHTFLDIISSWEGLLIDLVTVNYALNIPHTNYYLNSIGLIIYSLMAANATGVSITAKALSGEPIDAGWHDLFVGAWNAENERHSEIMYLLPNDVIKKQPTDPNPNRFDIETARDYRFFIGTTGSRGILIATTYYNITYSTTLTIQGSAGGTVNIKVYRVDNNELILSTSRTGNGNVTLTWYDNTIDVYADCYESDTRLGRSAIFNFGD